MTGGMGKIERYLTFKVCLLKIPTLAVKRLVLTSFSSGPWRFRKNANNPGGKLSTTEAGGGKPPNFFYSHIEELKMIKEWPEEQIFDWGAKETSNNKKRFLCLIRTTYFFLIIGHIFHFLFCPFCSFCIRTTSSFCHCLPSFHSI